jgi:hypothetical protein
MDLVSVSAQDEAAILLGKQTDDSSVVGHRVRLHFAAPLANMIFEHPAGGVKGIADRDVDVLMRLMRGRIAADSDRASGDFEVDTDPEQIAMLAARMPAFHDNPA